MQILGLLGMFFDAVVVFRSVYFFQIGSGYTVVKYVKDPDPMLICN